MGKDGICYATILETYLNALDVDRIPTYGACPLIRTGRVSKKTKPSSFVNSPMGVNYLQNVGKDIAAFLGFVDPSLYTGHCFRRTSVTVMANAGATVMELKQKCHWTNDKMANCYVANSDENMNKIAQYITGVDVKTEPAEKPAVSSSISCGKEEPASSSRGNESASISCGNSNEEFASISRGNSNEEPAIKRSKVSPFGDASIFSGNSIGNCTINITLAPK